MRTYTRPRLIGGIAREYMFSVSRIHRRDAEFAEKSCSEDSIGLGFGFNSRTDFLCVLCVSAVNKYDRGFFRTQLARRLAVRRVPRLTFVLDETLRGGDA